MEVMNKKITLLDYTLTEQGWQWQAGRTVWASAAASSRRALFSPLSTSTMDTAEVVCHEALPLMQCIRIDGRTAFVTEIIAASHQRSRMLAAFAEPAACFFVNNAGETVNFEGILAEKYIRYLQIDPYAMSEHTLILVTPKAVVIDPGKPVRVGEHDCHVIASHLLEACRNEYEILRHEEH